jgi:hypothetical protein
MDNQMKNEFTNAIQKRDYTLLPQRLIVTSHYLERRIKSFGVIAYCLSTNRWLLVQRKNTPVFLFIMRGSYRQVDLKIYVPNLYITEIYKLHKILDYYINTKNINLNDYDIFDSIFDMVIYTYDKDLDRKYAKMRFYQSRYILKELLEQNPKGINDIEWLWPKGRLQKTSGQETPYQCAVREFREETGINIKTEPIRSKNQILVSQTQTINEHFRGINNKNYETRCWLFIFTKIYFPSPVIQTNKPSEIGNRLWMTELETIRALHNTNRLHTLEQAKKMIYNYLIENHIIRPCPVLIENDIKSESRIFDLYKKKHNPKHYVKNSGKHHETNNTKHSLKKENEDESSKYSVHSCP